MGVVVGGVVDGCTVGALRISLGSIKLVAVCST